MRSEWKIIVLLFFFINCYVYIRRSHEEIAQLPTEIYSLPESLFVLPDSSDQWLLRLEKKAYGGVMIGGSIQYPDTGNAIFIYALLANGRLTMFGESMGRIIPRKAIHEFILMLNNDGFFSVTEQQIDNKIFRKKRTCLGCLIGEPKIFPPEHLVPVRKFLPHDYYVITFRLKYFNHQVEFMYDQDDTERYSYLKELQMLKSGIDSTEKFLLNEMWEINY